MPRVGNRDRKLVRDRQAVSPVIGTILMVAITVMLASGVYVWTTLFDDNQQSLEQVKVRTMAVDSDNDGQTDWMRITMTSADDAPYSFNIVELQILDPNGELLTDKKEYMCIAPDHILTADRGIVCDSDAQILQDPALDPDGNSAAWTIGQSLYVPCQPYGSAAGSGEHLLTLTIRTTTIIDDKLRCDEPSTGASR